MTFCSRGIWKSLLCGVLCKGENLSNKSAKLLSSSNFLATVKPEVKKVSFLEIERCPHNFISRVVL